ncbi:hypothetical protein [Lacrimispora brassicae]
MGNKNSSFHMSNEFNGYGQKTYLTASQYNSLPALSQENVRLMPDFGSSIAKALGSMPVVINANSDNHMLLKALGGMSSANQIVVGKDNMTGQFLFSYNVSASNEFANNSYLLASQNNSAQPVFEIVPYGWKLFRSEKGWKWGEETGNYYRKEGWLKDNGKWYYFSDYWMQTEWQKIVYEGKAQWFYFFSKKDSSGVEKYGHMVTSWIELEYNGEMHWFYFHGNGTMAVSEWIGYKGKWYFQRSNGTMQKSSLREWKGKLYYLKDDGSMAVSETIIDKVSGKTYFADADGGCAERNKIEEWMQSVEAMGTWYVANVSTYLSNDGKNTNRRAYSCPLIYPSVYDDCSSYVSACLVYVGSASSTQYNSWAYNKSSSNYSAALGTALSSVGFVWHAYDSTYIPARGDIQVQHNGCHHVEVIDSYDTQDGSTSIWSWGKVYSSLPVKRSKASWTSRTSGYWRIEK